MTSREEVDGCKRLVRTTYDGEGRMTYQWIENENGDMLSRTNYDADGTIILQYVDEYDKAGNLILETEIAGEETSIIRKYAHTYDETGRLVETVELHDNGNIMTRTHYDKNSNLIEMLCYGEDGEVISHTRYTYDNKGNCLSEVSEGGSCITNKYNDEGELLERNWVYSSGETKKTIYLVSREGNTETRESITYRGERKVGHHKEITQYHDNGKKHIYQMIDNDKLLTYEEYNTRGDIILKREAFDDGEEYEWKYSYQYRYLE